MLAGRVGEVFDAVVLDAEEKRSTVVLTEPGRAGPLRRPVDAGRAGPGPADHGRPGHPHRAVRPRRGLTTTRRGHPGPRLHTNTG